MIWRAEAARRRARMGVTRAAGFAGSAWSCSEYGTPLNARVAITDYARIGGSHEP
jgi:hypothetical protein